VRQCSGPSPCFQPAGQQAGLSLNEIALMLDHGDGAAWRPPAHLRLERITAELTQLQSAKVPKQRP